ncbi:Rep protein [Staphylococcus sp. GDY8P112P]|uniref:rolling circle replication-associated protein n=1 Tax=Staphylococcus sp. GDY8P112P TaxID=2804151 RepID=UPI001AEBF53B|nr:Rep protein [Staphylococcus sp. GDY8P112P]
MYNIKIIETDKKIEVWKYSLPIHNNYSMKEFENNNIERRKQSEMSHSEKMEAFQRKGKYYREKRHDIRRLIEMNYVEGHTKFVTLTFSNHVTDVEKANYEFKKFIERFKYKLQKGIKYLAVWERTKKDRIHYHMVIFDLKYIKWSDLEKVWGNGFIKINDVSHVESENVGRYIAKYFSKELDIRDYKKKAFFTSKNLKKPKKITLQSHEELENLFNLNNSSYSKTYKQLSKVEDKYIEGEVDYYIIEKDE